MLTGKQLLVRAAMHDETKCRECHGTGQVDKDGVSLLEWQALPGVSRLAYDMGMVRVKTCVACEGSGEPKESTS